MMENIKRTIMIVLFLTLVFSTQVAKIVSADDNWQFELTPYFWLPSVDADTTVNGQTVSLDLSFRDILDEFDVFAISGRFEAWKDNQWGVMVDALYVDLDTKKDFPLPLINQADVDIEQAWFEFTPAYRFDFESYSIDIFGGLRWTRLKQRINLVPGPNLGDDKDWVEPFFGVRWAWPFAEKWSFLTRGDIGGFGISSASDFTWNFLAGFDWRAWQNASIKFGYRVYGLDYESGSGANRFGFDGILHGPQLGVTFYF